MAFNFKKREKSGLPALTEEDIRNRLYGSAVGISIDEREKPHKKRRPSEDKTRAAEKKPDDEQTRVQGELLLLKKELEETKKRLKRMRNVKSKKMRLLFISFAVFAAGIIITAIIIKAIFRVTTDSPHISKATVSTLPDSKGGYAIQVATYGAISPAEKFSSELNSKGYKTFIYKTRYESGKNKFIVYAGRFKDKDDASKTLSRLRSKEGIGDSFIVSSPK